MGKDNWDKYRSRLNTARGRISNMRNIIITKRAEVLDIQSAISLTDREMYIINKKMHTEIVTKDDWIRNGYPIIPKLDDVVEFQNWKAQLRRRF